VFSDGPVFEREVGMTRRVGFATSTAFPELFEDDRPLIEAGREAGWTGVPAVWDDASIDWSTFDAVVVRSTWDYHRRRPEFLEWARKCAAATTLFNDLETIRWNSHKSYLLELGKRGIPIVPTELGRAGEALGALVERRGWSEVVVKPAVSANAEDARWIARAQIPEFEPTYQALLTEREWLVQPFLPSVLDLGERSLVYFDGRFSHAFRKGPALPKDLRKESGTPSIQATDPERSVADRAIAAVTPRPLYARVDLATDGNGDPRIMELELIEPFLGLSSDPALPLRFLRALSERCPHR
jgi:glutathione synthase/RimK-type ligase-like ATP-grasp enzyme